MLQVKASVLSAVLENCLAQWSIPTEKVQLIVSDNGENMVKAIKLMQEKELLKEQNEFKNVATEATVTP